MKILIRELRHGWQLSVGSWQLKAINYELKICSLLHICMVMNPVHIFVKLINFLISHNIVKQLSSRTHVRDPGFIYQHECSDILYVVNLKYPFNQI